MRVEDPVSRRGGLKLCPAFLSRRSSARDLEQKSYFEMAYSHYFAIANTFPHFRTRGSVGNDYISESLSGRFTLATGCVARRTTCSVVLPNDAKEDLIILV